jgi:hypothetical protein
MKTIQLTQGQVALVDDADFEALNAFKWCAARNNGGRYYAVRSVYDAHGKKTGQTTMHRHITGATTGRDVDHENGDGLDNQRHNLRLCSEAQNAFNKRKCRTRVCKSPFKGVRPTRGGRYNARITFQGRLMGLGVFTEEIDAARAYDAAATRYHGQFANINFPTKCLSN